ncbi:MAG: hypothetical protein SNJ29_15515 [Rikenellaceae bacterium]
MYTDSVSNFNRTIKGIFNIIDSTAKLNNDTNGGVLDMSYEYESLCGLAMIVMQNFINKISSECYRIEKSQYVNAGKTFTIGYKEYYRKLRAKGDKISGSNYTEIQLIYSLANSYKHRSESFILLCDDLDNSGSDYTELHERSYQSPNLKILLDFDLLTKINDDDPDWGIYPAYKGVLLMDGCLQGVTNRVIAWAQDRKIEINNNAVK